MNKNKIDDLKNHSLWVRQRILRMISNAGHGHIGGSLSCTDILVYLYLGGALNVKSDSYNASNRDRYIHSKGHASEVLYAVLSRANFFSENLLDTYGQNGSPLGGHVDSNLPGIELSTGSLGNGLGFGAGMALGSCLKGHNYSTFVMMGDGECYEGSVWEAVSFAGHHKLGNLIGIVDRNREITLSNTEDCNSHEPFRDKWKAFGWHVIETNGHDFNCLDRAFAQAKAEQNCPVVIIAETIKGKGISFMENELGWHHRVPQREMLLKAKRELGMEQ